MKLYSIHVGDKIYIFNTIRQNHVVDIATCSVFDVNTYHYETKKIDMSDFVFLQEIEKCNFTWNHLEKMYMVGGYGIAMYKPENKELTKITQRSFKNVYSGFIKDDIFYLLESGGTKNHMILYNLVTKKSENKKLTQEQTNVYYGMVSCLMFDMSLKDEFYNVCHNPKKSSCVIYKTNIHGLNHDKIRYDLMPYYNEMNADTELTIYHTEEKSELIVITKSNIIHITIGVYPHQKHLLRHVYTRKGTNIWFIFK